MSEKKRLTIGVMIGNANSVHSVNTLKGIRQAAKEAGVNTVAFLGVHTEYMFRDFYDEEISYDYQVMTVYDYIKLSKCDALIISYGELVVFLKESQKAGWLDKFKDIPKIVLEEYSEEIDPNTKYQISDNYNGFRAVVEHLVKDHGYRNFVCLRGPIGNKDADQRHKAFMDVMRENNIEVTDDMVRCGDFSEAVEAEIEYLFDHNPVIDAFVCANDAMATTVYKVCRKRRNELFKMTPKAREWMLNSPFRYKIGVDIESGEGIAVTGYDDRSIAAILDPPMTTVIQNEYALGYKAVYNVINLCKNKCGENIILQTRLVKRSSCGCADLDQLEYESMRDEEKQNPEFYVIRLAEKIKNSIIISDVNEGISDRVYDAIYDILYADMVISLGYVKERLSSKQVIEQLRSLLNGPYGEYISPSALTKAFSEYLSAVIKKSDNHDEQVLLTEILVEGLKYLQGCVYRTATDSLSEFENNTWFMSMIARDMANHVYSEKQMYHEAMRKIQSLTLGDTYIFTLKEPVILEDIDDWECPDRLFLSGYAPSKGEAVAYAGNERPILTAETGFEPFIHKEADAPFHITLSPLYSDRTQYGLLVSEVAPGEVLSNFYASVQIGTALKYNEMSRAQREAQKSLQLLVNEVEEKNSMLRFISEYDELTGCLNRRGFIERAVSVKNENAHRKYAAVFADLDHLKEINDKFGHAEGDAALVVISGILRDSFGNDQVLGRLGGDEFVSVIPVTSDNSVEEIINGIKIACHRYNETSDKPYYVECSTGYSEFICEKELQLQDELDKADKALYINKRSRRKSVCKD